MKIAVTSKGTDLDSEIDERFGRAAYILIVDPDSMNVEVLDNAENNNAAQGAGIQAASMVSGKGAQALLTGFCGPKAMTAFSGVGIQVFTGQAGTVRQAVEAYKQGNLQPSATANVGEKFGMAGAAPQAGNTFQPRAGGRGMGGGRRCLGGSGRGMGMGRATGIPGAGDFSLPASPQKENIDDLKKQAAELQRQMDAIQNKIKNM